MSEFGQRILLLVPHPDDEIVACAATAKRALQAGSQIYALYLTHGCIAYETLWPWQRKTYNNAVSRRREESLAAALRIGLIPTGFSDRPARSLRTRFAEAIDEIKAAIDRHQIDQLWVPAYEGGNADHDSLNGLVSLMALRWRLPVLEFAEYNFKGGHACAQTFPAPNGTETTLTLTPEEQAEKKALLKIYVSEQKNLGYVGTAQESYRPLAAYDYSKLPHEGTLWYTRFHWVPFRHPRIDFTKPQEVCAALASLKEATSGSPESATPEAPAHKE